MHSMCDALIFFQLVSVEKKNSKEIYFKNERIFIDKYHIPTVIKHKHLKFDCCNLHNLTIFRYKQEDYNPS